RPLASARIEGSKWKPEPVTFRVKDPAPRVEVDEAHYLLKPSAPFVDRWDLHCERRVELRHGARLKRYFESVRAPPTILSAPPGLRDSHRVALAINGVTRYEMRGALARTPSRVHGTPTAFEWVGLLCRYGAVRATLRLSRTNADGLE